MGRPGVTRPFVAWPSWSGRSWSRATPARQLLPEFGDFPFDGPQPRIVGRRGTLALVTLGGDDLRGALRGAFSRHDAALASAPRSQRASSSSRTRTHRPMRRARRLPFLISWRIVHSDNPERFATAGIGLRVGSVATVICGPLKFRCRADPNKERPGHECLGHARLADGLLGL